MPTICTSMCNSNKYTKTKYATPANTTTTTIKYYRIEIYIYTFGYLYIHICAYIQTSHETYHTCIYVLCRTPPYTSTPPCLHTTIYVHTLRHHQYLLKLQTLARIYIYSYILICTPSCHLCFHFNISTFLHRLLVVPLKCVFLFLPHAY